MSTQTGGTKMSDPVKKGDFELAKACQTIGGGAMFATGIIFSLSPDPEMNSLPFANGFIAGAGGIILLLGLMKVARQYGTDNPVVFAEEGS